MTVDVSDFIVGSHSLVIRGTTEDGEVAVETIRFQVPG